MNIENDDLKGSINVGLGEVKKTVGHITGNENLKAEGAAQKAKGKTQKFTGAVHNAYQKGKDLLGLRSKKN